MEDHSGRRLGNYLLTRVLARGGYAEVYLGRHIYLNSQAALKVLLTPLSGDERDGLAIGSIAGFATIFTKGNYHSIKNILIAEAFSVLGILCAFFIAFNGFWPRLYSGESVWLDFTHIALPNVVLVLILIFITLIINNAIARRKRHA